MPRPTSAIQARIAVIEADLATTFNSAGSDGTSISRNTEALNKELNFLYAQLDRVNGTSPMLVRGRVKGLR